MSKEKKGSGHAAAWLRAGAKELSTALVAFPNHAIQPVEEPGLFGNVTQMDVNQQKGKAMPYEQWLEARAPIPQRETPALDLGRER